jgi:hypothetical protein
MFFGRAGAVVKILNQFVPVMTKYIPFFCLIFCCNSLFAQENKIAPVHLKNVKTSQGFWHDRVAIRSECDHPACFAAM